MDSIKLRYSGRISAGKIKKREIGPLAPGMTEFQEYISSVLHVFGLEQAQILIAHLGLSSVTNLQKKPEGKPRAARGAKGISSYGRSVVKDGCQWLEDASGRQTLSFLTLTIPPEALVPELFEGWSDLMRKLRQTLVYHLRQAGLSGQLIAVVEVQESRQVSEGDRPALHIHALFQGRKGRGHPWAMAPQQVDRIWQALLSKTVGANVEVKSASRIEPVRKSASGYMGKYMSKGLKALSQINPKYLPSAWYMCTRDLLKKVQKLVRYISGEAANWIYEHVRYGMDIMKYQRDIIIENDQGDRYFAGWYGEIRERADYFYLAKLFDEMISVRASANAS